MDPVPGRPGAAAVALADRAGDPDEDPGRKRGARERVGSDDDPDGSAAVVDEDPEPVGDMSSAIRSSSRSRSRAGPRPLRRSRPSPTSTGAGSVGRAQVEDQARRRPGASARRSAHRASPRAGPWSRRGSRARGRRRGRPRCPRVASWTNPDRPASSAPRSVVSVPTTTAAAPSASARASAIVTATARGGWRRRRSGGRRRRRCSGRSGRSATGSATGVGSGVGAGVGSGVGGRRLRRGCRVGGRRRRRVRSRGGRRVRVGSGGRARVDGVGVGSGARGAGRVRPRGGLVGLGRRRGRGGGVGEASGVGSGGGVPVGTGAGTGGAARFWGFGEAWTKKSATLSFVSLVLPAMPPGRRSRLEPAAGAGAARALDEAVRGVAPPERVDRRAADRPQDDRPARGGKPAAVGRVGDRGEDPSRWRSGGAGPARGAARTSRPPSGSRSRRWTSHTRARGRRGRRQRARRSRSRRTRPTPKRHPSGPRETTRVDGGQPTAAAGTRRGLDEGRRAASATVPASRMARTATTAAARARSTWRPPGGRTRRAGRDGRTVLARRRPPPDHRRLTGRSTRRQPAAQRRLTRRPSLGAARPARPSGAVDGARATPRSIRVRCPPPRRPGPRCGARPHQATEE